MLGLNGQPTSSQRGVGPPLRLDRHDFADRVQDFRCAVYDTVGCVYRAGGGAPDAFPAMRHYGMLPSYNGQFTFRGQLTGRAYGDQRFSLCDVTAHKRPIQHKDVAPKRGGFEGVILTLDHYTPFRARTIIRSDVGLVNPMKIDEMKRVGFVDRAFEDVFEVYSDDQVEARALITPDFMERLLVFAGDYLGRGVQVAFLGQKMHISLDIDDRFDFTRDYKAFDVSEASTLLFHEVGAVFTLLEAVQSVQARIGRKGARATDKARQTHYTAQLEFLRKAVAAGESHWRRPTDISEDMRDTYYLFCDGLRGLASPRF